MAAGDSSESGVLTVGEGNRVRLRHYTVDLEDGSRAGISVGGFGIPLVFFHGIGMNRRSYLRLLSRLPQLGFTVIAVDAPGHGDSSAPHRGARSFAARVMAADAVLDTLGVERALLVGHSMGGRTAAEIAAVRPDRVIGAVLIDPALGAAFDDARSRARSPSSAMRGLIDGAFDTARDRVGLRGFGVLNHFGMMGGRAVNTIAHPRLFASTASAIVRSVKSASALEQLRQNAIPVLVVHGERDMIVPLDSAVDAARLSGGTLVTLPSGYHSWVLSSPWTFVHILRQAVMRGALGDEVRSAIMADTAAIVHLHEECVRPNARLRQMIEPPQVIGRAEPRNGRLYHDFRIWDEVQAEGTNDAGA